MRQITRWTMPAVLAGLLLAAAVGANHRATVTRGTFETLAGGTDLGLRGHATMVRIPRTDTTRVRVHWPENSAVRLACLDLA